MAVFVVDRRQAPLMPCSEKRARLLLARGRARVHRLIPFTIRLIDREVALCELQPLELKIDPGSKTSGLALVRNSNTIEAETGEITATAHVLNLFELIHRGVQMRGGSNRVSNLTLACAPCNLKKAAQAVTQFLEKDPKRLATVQAQAKRPLRDAAAVNATRWALFNALKATGLSVRSSSGGLTKCNRSKLGIPKTHALDAVCVGQVDHVEQWQKPTLAIKATGRGSYQRTRLTRFGFPRGYLTRQKRIHGFQTGDRVKAIVTKGKKVGVYMGRVAVRVSGSFNIQTAEGLVQGISHRYCTLIQRSDGYGYSLRSDSN